jgi:hypothetical protein
MATRRCNTESTFSRFLPPDVRKVYGACFAGLKVFDAWGGRRDINFARKEINSLTK